MYKISNSLSVFLEIGNSWQLLLVFASNHKNGDFTGCKKGKMFIEKGVRDAIFTRHGCSLGVAVWELLCGNQRPKERDVS